jgi:hypothetical protein
MVMNSSKAGHLLIVFFILVLSACSPYKQLDKDQYLLDRNVVITDKPELKDGIKAIIKQKANRRILGVFRFHLTVYSIGNRGKPNKFKNWLKNTVGEEPVLLDTLFTNKSSSQIKQFMAKNGYFKAEVNDTTIYRHKKAKVKYIIKANEPSYISKVVRESADSGLDSLVRLDTAGSKLKAGIIYRESILQGDRERLSQLLRNNGYYQFSPQYVSYRVYTSDTTQNLIVFQDVSMADNADTSQGVKFIPHKKFYLNRIIFNPDYDPLRVESITQKFDSVYYKDYIFLKYQSKKLPVRPEVIANHTFFRKGNVFRQRNSDYTYKSLNLLGLYRFVNINYELSYPDSNLLDCFVNLGTSSKQEYVTEIEGTNNGGNLGVAGNYTYRNRNVFRGAEIFEFKLRGALESQKNFTTEEERRILYLFNTYELGVESSIHLPKAIGAIQRLFKRKAANPNTVFSANYNIQNRPEFNRSILEFSAGVEWRKGMYVKHIVTPFQVNFVNVKLSPSFESELLSLNDPVLYSSYQNHLITNGRYSFIYNNQVLNVLKNFVFFRANAEFAGNTLQLFSEINKSPKSDQGSYQVLKKNYAQYFRPDVDFRLYQTLNEHSTIVYRIAGGIGVAYGNSKIMPFEKSFYAGGSNDLRAFRARNVGPGNFRSDNNFERTGDIKLNANLEYRFDILKILKGAFFMDAGNIWLRKKDASRLNAEFDINRFYKQLAVGSGVGFRFDFTFFIFRFDLGVPIVDPQYGQGQNVVVGNLKLKSLISNFGIGYPF